MSSPTESLLLLTSPFGTLALSLDELHLAIARANEISPICEGVLPADLPKRLLDAKTAGRMLGISPSWLLQRARERRIPHLRIGKYVRFDVDEIRTKMNQEPW